MGESIFGLVRRREKVSFIANRKQEWFRGWMMSYGIINLAVDGREWLFY